MAIQFPIGPFIGDTFPYDDMVYVWDGEKWTAQNDKAYWDKDGDELKPEDTGDDVNLGTGDLSANNGNFDGDVVVDGDLTVAGDIQASSFNGGPLAGLRNQLINGQFNIQQRGTNFPGPVNGYTFDRWFASGSLSLSTTTNTPDVGQSAIAVSGGGFLGQGIELFSKAYPFVSGSTWTVSFQATQLPTNVYVNFRDGVGNTANQVVIAQIPASSFVENPALQPANTDYKHYSASFTVTSTGADTTKCVEVTFEFPAAMIRLSNVMLEPGPVATPFEFRPIATENALCQRYYQPNIKYMLDSQTGPLQNVRLSVNWAPMRTTPSVIILDQSINIGEVRMDGSLNYRSGDVRGYSNDGEGHKTLGGYLNLDAEL